MGPTKSISPYRSGRHRTEGNAAVLDSNGVEVSSADASGDEPEAGPAMSSAPARKPAPPSTTADEVEALYLKHRTLLLFIACRKFRVPECDAESLIQEVFLSFLQTDTKIDNVRAWLVAAMCNASRHYWRSQGRTESLPEDFDDRSDPSSVGLAETFATSMTVRQAMRYLQPRCRETLRLHYFEGRSSGEVARELETTTRYAEKLIHNCLKRVREIYTNITAVNR
jgi:RNA polymerase sigma factor (sigma-70 family)